MLSIFPIIVLLFRLLIRQIFIKTMNNQDSMELA